MNRHVNSISGRLSLRQPQRDSLAILDRICEILPPKKGSDRTAGLAAIQSEFPTLTDFDREFPSLCFSLATGVGKTRLMGAFISYLYLEHGIRNFFVLAPNLTIYNKLITDFTANTPKYVFKGISEFAINAPEIVTGDNYDKAAILRDLFSCKINIFNISKINSEVRGGKSPKIKRLSEYIGESYFDYLANLPDLVILMDESHRYRASAGIRAINELKPVLGLELTATPFVETSKGGIPFKNVIFDYPLGRAMVDGFVKEPAVVTRKDFNPAGMSPEAIEDIKLKDGIRFHESIKVDLETYARNANVKIVKPFILVIARDTTHAAQLFQRIQSDEFFEGRYREKIIQVDSSTKEDETIERLLKVESPDEPTEIVIHVNMLKEGWDVTNLYTIIPLRAANARILIEQTIGRGLRLPYGKRTGVAAVDRLNIIAHDKFQEIVDESRRSDSQIRMQQLILPPESLQEKSKTVVSQSHLENLLGSTNASSTPTKDLTPVANTVVPKPVFKTVQEQDIAKIAYQAIRDLERQPQTVPTTAHLASAQVQALVKEAVTQIYKPAQLELEGVIEQPDIADIIAKTTEFVIQQTIDIPRILVVPKGEVRSGFHPFVLDLRNLNYPVPSEDLIRQTLGTQETEVIVLDRSSSREVRPEDYIVSGLVDFDDISYDEQADLLYDLADQVVKHFQTYLSKDDLEKVLQVHQRPISKLIHAQMQPHFWEEAIGYDVKVSQGFTELKQIAYTTSGSAPLNFKQSPSDKSNMSKYLFGGFSRCLYPVQKFDSDSERILSVILDRESLKWFKPAKSQFQIYYRCRNGEHHEYQPDFVAETDDMIYMLEPKARNQMDDADVNAKKVATIQWCQRASNYSNANGGKPWNYILIPHDEIRENMTLKGLSDRFASHTVKNE